MYANKGGLLGFKLIYRVVVEIIYSRGKHDQKGTLSLIMWKKLGPRYCSERAGGQRS